MNPVERLASSKILASRTRTQWYLSNGNWIMSRNETNPIFVNSNNWTMRRSWFCNPNFSSIRRSGGVHPDLPYSYTLRAIEDNIPGYYQYVTSSGQWSGTLVRVWQTKSDLLSIPVVDEELPLSAVSSKLIARAKQHQFNAPVFVAEAAKTSTMVKERAMHLFQMVRHLRRGNIKGFLDLLHPSVRVPRNARSKYDRFVAKHGVHHGAANTWLEYAYGWTPFLGEVASATNTLLDLMEIESNRVGVVKASYTDLVKRSYPDATLFIDPVYTGLIVQATRSASVKRSVRAVWRFEAASSEVPGRFTLLNPLEVAWELVPFSFVADWFLPIGDYLSSLDTSFRFTHKGGTIGTRSEAVTTYSTLPPSASTVTITGWGGKVKDVVVRRSALSTIPNPKLSEMFWRSRINAAQATSAVTLLHQQLVRLGR